MRTHGLLGLSFREKTIENKYKPTVTTSATSTNNDAYQSPVLVKGLAAARTDKYEQTYHLFSRNDADTYLQPAEQRIVDVVFERLCARRLGTRPSPHVLVVVAVALMLERSSSRYPALS